MVYWIHYINKEGKIDKMTLDLYEIYTGTNSDLFNDMKSKITQVLFIDDIPEAEDSIFKLKLRMYELEKVIETIETEIQRDET